MIEWVEFNACIREKINDSRFQLAMTAELYEHVMKFDAANVGRRKDILLLEQCIMEDMTRMIALMAKYHTVQQIDLDTSMARLMQQLN